MDWQEWALNGARDLVLLAAGGGIAWISGVSASRRTERIEDEKEKSRDAAEKRQAVQLETRKALGIVYDLERLVDDETPRDPREDADLPRETAAKLRNIADVIPDVVVRQSIDNFLEVFNAWRLLSEWADDGPVLPDDTRLFQRLMLAHLREVLAAAARGESPSTEGAAQLELTAVHKAVALDAYWAQQAEDYEYFKTGRK